MVEKTQLMLVYELLKEGDGTSKDLSIETGLSLRHCSAHLSKLAKIGLAKHIGWVREETCEHCGRRGRNHMLYTAIEVQRADKAKLLLKEQP